MPEITFIVQTLPHVVFGAFVSYALGSVVPLAMFPHFGYEVSIEAKSKKKEIVMSAMFSRNLAT